MTRTHRTIVTLSFLSLLTPGFNRLARSQSSVPPEASKKTFVISGSVGVAGVVMKGLPGEVVSEQDGSYSVQVDYRWTGDIIPMKDGHSFVPVRRSIGHVTQNQANVNFTAKVTMLTIRDQIMLGEAPIQGVRVTAEPGGSSVVTDARGRYSIEVPYGWSGELFLAKPGFEFDPPSLRYDHVTEDIDLTTSRRPVPPLGTVYPRAMASEAVDDVLVVPTTAASAVQFAQLAEDMRVMLNILREKLSEPRTIRGVLYDYGDFFPTGRTVEALYLQRHAAIFMLKVDFPLSPPGSQEAVEAQETEPADPVWQRARDRLYSPQSANLYGRRGMSREADERTFEQLKEDLVKTLKHAANIRNMDANELIILTVTGRGEAGLPGMPGSTYGISGSTGAGGSMWGAMSGYGGGAAGGSVGGYGGGYGTSSGSFNYGGGGSFHMDSGLQSGVSRRRGIVRSPAGSVVSSPTTVLTIQARRGDIDAFAEGTSSFEQFQQKVKVFTY